jgi:heme/copper-type cytochrome/quinol oxidase subunit 3
VKHVVMTSDEQDEAWWRQVAEMGWKAIDHSQTEETHGPWSVFIFLLSDHLLK